MAEINNYLNDDLNDEVDFEFFNDNISEISNSNNNAIVKSSKDDVKSISSSNVVRDTDENSKHSSKKSNTPKYNDSGDDTSTSSNGISPVSLSTKSLKNLSNNSNISEKEDSSKSTDKDSNSRSSLSAKPSNSQVHHSSQKNSDSESDVTSVSSLDSDNSSRAPYSRKPPKKMIKSSQTSKYHTHFQSIDDVDMLPTGVILQAMMRIHEERRLVQKMKPKWVDPNTKDYSVSGITSKLNLVPERIVSMPKKDIRWNPFYFNNVGIEKRLYHTAINRSKEKDRISKENKEILSRLQRIRPSPGITKEELLKEYSKINRFLNPQKTRSRIVSTTPSYRPQSSTNSDSGSKIRRTHSSTIVSRFDDGRQSNSQKSEPKRVMSANSLTLSGTRRSSTLNSLRK